MTAIATAAAVTGPASSSGLTVEAVPVPSPQKEIFIHTVLPGGRVQQWRIDVIKGRENITGKLAADTAERVAALTAALLHNQAAVQTTFDDNGITQYHNSQQPQTTAFGNQQIQLQDLQQDPYRVGNGLHFYDVLRTGRDPILPDDAVLPQAVWDALKEQVAQAGVPGRSCVSGHGDHGDHGDHGGNGGNGDVAAVIGTTGPEAFDGGGGGHGQFDASAPVWDGFNPGGGSGGRDDLIGEGASAPAGDDCDSKKAALQRAVEEVRRCEGIVSNVRLRQSTATGGAAASVASAAELTAAQEALVKANADHARALNDSKTVAPAPAPFSSPPKRDATPRLLSDRPRPPTSRHRVAADTDAAEHLRRAEGALSIAESFVKRILEVQPNSRHVLEEQLRKDKKKVQDAQTAVKSSGDSETSRRLAKDARESLARLNLDLAYIQHTNGAHSDAAVGGKGESVAQDQTFHGPAGERGGFDDDNDEPSSAAAAAADDFAAAVAASAADAAADAAAASAADAAAVHEEGE